MCPTVAPDHRCPVRLFAGADAPDLDAQHLDVHHARCEVLSRLDWEQVTVEAHYADQIALAATAEQVAHLDAALHAEQVIFGVIVQRVTEAIAPEEISDPGLLNEVADMTRRGVLDLPATLAAAVADVAGGAECRTGAAPHLGRSRTPRSRHERLSSCSRPRCFRVIEGHAAPENPGMVGPQGIEP